MLCQYVSICMTSQLLAWLLLVSLVWHDFGLLACLAYLRLTRSTCLIMIPSR